MGHNQTITELLEKTIIKWRIWGTDIEGMNVDPISLFVFHFVISKSKMC